MPEYYSIAQAEAMNWPVLLGDTSSSGIAGVALNRPVCVVGGRCLVHLPLDSQTVSKSHALIVHDPAGIYIRDLASKNKTYVNGHSVREVWLNPADEVRIGEFAFRCHYGFDHMNDLPPAPPAELWLDPDGLASRQVVTVTQQSFLIGSRRSADLPLAGDEVALAHAVIFAREGHRYLRDLSTMTGTTVNGRRIREIELQDGDEIRVAANRLEYHPLAPMGVTAAALADGTVFGFADESVDDPIAPALAPTVQFQPAGPVATAPVASEGNIILPWDEPEPIEIELADSKT